MAGMQDALIKMMGVNPDDIKKQFATMLAQYNATVKYFDEQQKRIEKKLDFLIEKSGHEYTAANQGNEPVRNGFEANALSHALPPGEHDAGGNTNV